MTYNYHGFTIISMSLSGFAIYKGSNRVDCQSSLSLQEREGKSSLSKDHLKLPLDGHKPVMRKG